MQVSVLWLCGADAAGKSTVGWEIYSRLTSSGRAAAYLDIDYLGFCTPQPGGDPTWLVERNLASMWATFADFTLDTDAVPVKTVADRVHAGIVANGWDLPSLACAQ